MKKYPKLTQEIFDLPQCPEWAVAAAVNPNGECYVYSTKDVKIARDYSRHFGDMCQGMGMYDNSNWQRSLVFKEGFDNPSREDLFRELPRCLYKGAWESVIIAKNFLEVVEDVLYKRNDLDMRKIKSEVVYMGEIVEEIEELCDKIKQADNNSKDEANK